MDDCKLYLPKIGHVKAVVHRDLIGQMKTVTVSKDPSGRYFASFLAENDTVMPEVTLAGKVLGIDVGLTHLAVTSDGSKFDNPKHIARAQSNLKRKQQALSHKVKGSNTRNKARVLVAKAHEKQRIHAKTICINFLNGWLTETKSSPSRIYMSKV